MVKRSRLNKLLFLYTLFFITTLVPFHMPKVYGQELLLITRKFDSEPLTEVLKQLSEEFGYYIAFDEDKLKELQVNADLSELSFENAITVILKDFKLTYQILDKKYVIVKEALSIPTPESKFQIQGSVIDAETGETLPYALITDLSTYKGGLTNEQGLFSMTLPEQADSLKISFLGYRLQVITREMYENEAVLDIRLKKETETLETLDVKRKKSLTSEVLSEEQSAMLVTNTVASELYSSQSNNLSYALQFLPGVSTQGGMSSAMQVRGGSSDQNLTLVDGFPLYQIGHYNNMFDLVNPVLGDSVKILKGGYDARYGNRVSSIVDVRLDVPSLTEVEGELGLQSLAFEGMISVPIIEGKLSLLWAGRKSHNLLPNTLYKDLYATSETNILYNENYASEDNSEAFRRAVFPNTSFYDTNLKLAYLHNTKNIFVFSSLFSEDEMSQRQSFSQRIPGQSNPNRIRTITIENKDNRTWNNQGASLEWTRLHHENAETKTYLSYGSSALSTDHFYNYNVNLLNNIIGIERDSAVHTHEEITDFGFHVDHKQQTALGLFELGGNWTYNQIDRISALEQSNTLLMSSNTLGTYAQLSASHKKLSYKLGARVWYYEPTQKTYFAPRASLRIEPTDAFALKFAGGRYFQFIHQISDPLSKDYQWLLVDDIGIPVQVSDHLIGGFSFKKGGSTWDVEVYQKKSKGDISQLTLRNPQYRDGLKGEGLSQGLDTFYEYTQQAWKIYASYAFNKYTGFFSNQREEQKTSHILQLAGMYQFRKVKFGLTWLWNNTNYEFIGFSKKQTDKYPLLRIVQEPFNIPVYHRLDFSAQYDFRLNDKFDAELGLVIYDLYNKQNLQETQITGFRYDGRIQYVLTDLYQTGFLPNLTFKVKF
ncbi:TonB-dependent receptor plug domain-containing protein [Sediminitomix flava]|uniref:Outer membrane receptor protein involved in Fe transport n=1 Tax=Sediminitomix flava TaxID=379075 RepID=A0A315ZCV8_SEDFL|nr:TonB-dependent receptor plug domain-containing protein [Sediminitomix flava]PWJ43140.1 outer membrane receptor protein involved in Fe transport [Sediminitomix flava]